MPELQPPSTQEVYPPFLEYPDAWRLGWSGPEGLYSYLTWILCNDKRTTSAADHFRFNGVGFHYLTVAQKVDSAGNILEKIDINFFSNEFPTTNESTKGAHAHARSMQLWGMYDPLDSQTVEQFKLLPPNPPIVPDIAAEEYDLAILHKLEAPDGKGSIYHPVNLGRRHATSTLLGLPPGGQQIFSSAEIHQVHWIGKKVGATILRQGPVESPAMNTIEAMMCYKGLTREDAEQVVFQQQQLQQLGKKVLSSTVLLRPPGYNLSTMEERPMSVPRERFPYLAKEARLSVGRLISSRKGFY